MSATAIEQMSAEHRHIETVINALQTIASQLETSSTAPMDTLRRCVEFLRVYADERHHLREEALFFPLLVQRGVPPQGCPIGGLNNDHAKGRALVTTLTDRLNAYEQNAAAARDALRQTLQELVQLYRHHLWMEDAMVFPMAEKLVTTTDNQALLDKFAELDRKIGSEKVARLEEFADQLAK